MTGRDWVTAALRRIGALAVGEAPSAEEATEGLAAGNRMLGTWSNQSLLIPAVIREEFSLTTGDQEYSMGSGADFDTTRPQSLSRARIEDQSASPAAEYPLEILTAEQWAEIQVKETGNTIPCKIYLEPTFPNATAHFYPKPQASLKAVLYTEKPLSELADLDDEFSLPPGYEDALVLNLAKKLQAEYGRGADPTLDMEAREAIAWIKRKNYRPRLLKCDAPVGRGVYDINTGGYR